MDNEQALEDKIIEREIVTGERIVEHPELGTLRLRRPTPRIAAKIAEIRREAWHRDLKNPDVLSTGEVEKILEKRGVWGPQSEEEIERLTRLNGEYMSRLHFMGFRTSQKLMDEFGDLLLEVVDELGLDADSPAQEALERIFDMEAKLSPEDVQAIYKAADGNEEVAQLLEKAQQLRSQIDLTIEMRTVREQLQELLELKARYFNDTAESRAEMYQKIAEVFYCVVNADTGEYLWDSVEEMWDIDPLLLAWLQTQLFYFNAGITGEFAQQLEEHGFMLRGVASGLLLEDSPDPPLSKPDGESAEKASPISSE